MSTKLYRYNFARNRFGQHFLTDEFIINSIISAIHPKLGDAIVEIGPGLGALTEPVIEEISHMTVIELDRGLAIRLKNNEFLREKLTIYQQDVMTVNFSKIAKQAGQPLRIFGNLPYNISTQLMFYLFTYRQHILDMHFMLQKEVVDRLVAGPGSKTYGRLSVMVQYYYKVIPVLEVPPTSFSPVPKVHSAVVRLLPHSVLKTPVSDVHLLNLITTKAFCQKRKMIRNTLSGICSPSQLMELGIDASWRAENISVEQYCKLANWIENNPLVQQ